MLSLAFAGDTGAEAIEFAKLVLDTFGLLTVRGATGVAHFDEDALTTEAFIEFILLSQGGRSTGADATGELLFGMTHAVAGACPISFLDASTSIESAEGSECKEVLIWTGVIVAQVSKNRRAFSPAKIC